MRPFLSLQHIRTCALVAVLLGTGGFAHAEDVMFRREVMAVISKAGCNAGACHGNGNGKGGFKLSLRGQDPDLDWLSMTREQGGRRVNLIQPENSLLLLKATAGIAHEGGQRFGTDSPELGILLQWLRDGAPDSGAQAPKLTKLEVTAPERVLVEPATQVKLHATATFADGATKDVTRLAVYEPNNLTAKISIDGLVTREKIGESTIAVRYLGQQVPVPIAFVPARPDFVWSNPPAVNFIDEQIFKKLRLLRTNPSEVCDDATFLRRALARSALPRAGCGNGARVHRRPGSRKAGEVDRRADGATGIRGLLDVEMGGLAEDRATPARLRRDEGLPRLDSREHRAEQAARSVRPRADRRARQHAPESARELVARQSRSGDARRKYRARFPRHAAQLRAVPQPPVRALDAGRLLQLGRPLCSHRLQGLQRQRHRQKRQARVQGRPDSADQGERFGDQRAHQRAGDAALSRRRGAEDEQGARRTARARRLAAAPHDRGGETRCDSPACAQTSASAAASRRARAVRRAPCSSSATPRFLGGEVPKTSKERDELLALADWLPHSPMFARMQVNRIWFHLLGRGLVDPVDDFRASNPPSHPELLEALAKDFVAHGYDLRQCIRTITASRTYQLASTPNVTNADDETNFSRSIVRRLTAEQLLDSISVVLATPLPLEDAPKGTRVAQLAEGRKHYRPLTNSVDRFAASFGKPPRLIASDCERSNDTAIPQAFQLISGPLIQQLLTRKDNALDKALSSGNDATTIDELFWTALSRAPTDAERERCTAHLAAGPDRRRATEDLAWALLNSKEFIFRH